MTIFYKRSCILACGLLRRSGYLLHQPCYAVIEGVQVVGSRMLLPISNLTPAAFYGWRKQEYPEETTAV